MSQSIDFIIESSLAKNWRTIKDRPRAELAKALEVMRISQIPKVKRAANWLSMKARNQK